MADSGEMPSLEVEAQANDALFSAPASYTGLAPSPAAIAVQLDTSQPKLLYMNAHGVTVYDHPPLAPRSSAAAVRPARAVDTVLRATAEQSSDLCAAPSSSVPSDSDWTQVDPVQDGARSYAVVGVRSLLARGFDIHLARILSDAHVRSIDIDLHAPRSLAAVISSMQEADFGAKSALIYTECIHERMRSHMCNVGTYTSQLLSQAPSLLRSVHRGPPPPPKHLTAKEREAAEVRRQVDWLLSTLPPELEPLMLGFRVEEWPLVPHERRISLRYGHLGSFSAGYVAAARNALRRLDGWLAEN